MKSRPWLAGAAIVVLVLSGVALFGAPRAQTQDAMGAIDRAGQSGGSTEPVEARGALSSGPDVDEASRAAIAMLAATGQGTPAPLTAAEQAEAEAFRTRLAAWAEELWAVYPYIAVSADPGTGDILESLPGDIDALSPEQLLAVEAVFTQHPGWWDFPGFVRALLSPDGAPMPLYYAELLAQWEAQGEIDYDTAVRLSRQADEEIQRALAQGAEVPGLPGAKDGAAAPDAVLTPNPTQAVPLPTMETFPPRGPLPDPQAASRPGCPGVFEQDTCDACPDYVPEAAIFASKIVSIIAKGISDAIPKEVDIAIFPGVGVTLPNPVKPIFLGISQAAEAVVRGLTFNNALADDCNAAYHAALTDLYLDATVSSRVTQASLDRQALLQLRTAIEENLLRPADERISLFQLPQAVCGQAIADVDTSTMTGYEGMRFCGQLEYVREIVEETIARNAAAGMTPELTRAEDALEAGDSHYMLSQWKSAYERYSAAYKYAVMNPATR
jgi:hypothetical protein